MADATSDDRKGVFGQCFHGCQATLIVGKEKKELPVCKEQLAKASEFFRAMFCEYFKEKNHNEFQITDESPEDVARFFDILISTDPEMNKITDDSVQLLLRLADKYQCDLLKKRLKIYIAENEPNCKSAATMLNWFIWSKDYNMPEETLKLCLPGVACLPLSTLRANREKFGWELYAKLLEAKNIATFRALEFAKEATDVEKCYSCEIKDRLPYKFYYCTRSFGFHSSRAYCSNCLQKGTDKIRRCCGFSDSYYKCFYCEKYPSYYETKEHCFCGRKNYEILLNETS